ncbi:hypothetical protein BCR32DRAFT_296305 [Anaeromyces robustus]|uniref:Uncharacterized protein n=1 Tax=Anaeromyces robustus TaxID=1754192 RepID=A0A1Y1WS04_9FUNG|nr:hypothetical protein BCR32DRAFT_296305 [Anaeromyces robustus]|eukprot:ORX76331.1 hypothetical protein BCR32DRAFT_296305 [Anaeromyces robustus]
MLKMEIFQFNVVAPINRNTTAIGLRINNAVFKLDDSNYPIWRGEYDLDEDVQYHYVSYNIYKKEIIQEENFKRSVQPYKNSKEYLNEFFNRTETVYQHPNLISGKEMYFTKNKYSELFNDQYISTIYLTGNIDEYKNLLNSHIMDEPIIPSLNVTATFITPYTVKKYKNLLLELNTYADIINTDIYFTTYYTNKYYFRKHLNPKKSSYFLSYQSCTSFEPISPSDTINFNLFNKTSIQLLSTSSDNLMIRNKMYTDICNAIEIPSAQIGYTRVYFNDIPLGFYLIKENPNIQYFKENYYASEMYSQMNIQYSPMNYVGDFNKIKSDPKLLNLLSILNNEIKLLNILNNNNKITDNDSNDWYQGIKNPKIFNAKNDLISLFSLYETPTSLDELNKNFETDSFLKNMALDYVVNNQHGYLFNGTNYFLYYDNNKNQWNYHEGYYSSPFNNWNQNYTYTEYNNFRFIGKGNNNNERPVFDYLMSFQNEKENFKSYINYISNNFFGSREFLNRMDSIFKMIHDDLKWDTLLEPIINITEIFNENKKSEKVLLTKIENDYTSLKKFITERKYEINKSYGSINILNVYSVFVTVFLISLAIIFVHLFYAVFINPLVWFYSNKKIRVLPSTFLKLWIIALVLLLILIITIILCIKNNIKKPNFLHYIHREIYYYIINYYGTYNMKFITFNIVLWLLLNRENFLVLLGAPFVRWPAFNKKLLNNNNNSNHGVNSSLTLNNEEIESNIYNDNHKFISSSNSTLFINNSRFTNNYYSNNNSTINSSNSSIFNNNSKTIYNNHSSNNSIIFNNYFIYSNNNSNNIANGTTTTNNNNNNNNNYNYNYSPISNNNLSNPNVYLNNNYSMDSLSVKIGTDIDDNNSNIDNDDEENEIVEIFEQEQEQEQDEDQFSIYYDIENHHNSIINNSNCTCNSDCDCDMDLDIDTIDNNDIDIDIDMDMDNKKRFISNVETKTISKTTDSLSEKLSRHHNYNESIFSKKDYFQAKNTPSYTDEQSKIVAMYQNIEHGFLIVCHNSSDVLPATLECLLKVTIPMCIFIAENGSNPEEREKMKRIVDNYSNKFRYTHPNYCGLNIIYANLNEGSKTLAQFCLLNNIFWFGINIQYISVIDDDVLIPENWVEKEILSYFKNDSKVKALAYPITASNRHEGIVPSFQNFEYILSMYSKKIHRDIGTVVFPSGAMGTWNVEFLLECLYLHDTVFRGDDLQLGLRLHTMYGRPRFCNPNKLHEGNYKIEIAHVTVDTLVPGCYIHLKEFVPKFIGKYLKECNCGQYSLSRQRIVYWEPARHRFFLKFLKCIFHKCRWNHRATLTAKLFCIDFIITIINDYAFIVLFIFMFLMKSFLPALMIICICFAIAYISLDVFNLIIARGNSTIKLPFEVCVVFPIFYQCFSTLFYRISTIIYTLTYYVPFVRNKVKIKNRALEKDIGSMTMTDIISVTDSEKAIANVSDISEFLSYKKQLKHKNKKSPFYKKEKYQNENKEKDKKTYHKRNEMKNKEDEVKNKENEGENKENKKIKYGFTKD